MKKTFCLILCFIICIGLFSACNSANTEDGASLKIVCTVFPLYDWTRNLTGNGSDTDVSLLLDSGVDLHSFQPTADDIIKIADCDLFIYVGGESDAWVDEALKTSGKNVAVIDLMDVLGKDVHEEEVKEGMEASEEDEEEETAYDEHIWLSLKNAEKCCKAISDKLSEIAPERKSEFEKNLNAYNEELTALDGEFEKAVSASKIKTILVADRFPFLYLAKDYGIDYFAAFVGCSAETEASFETVMFLAKKVDELGLTSVITTESSDGKLAKTVIDNTTLKNQKTVVMDSLQSATAEDISQGKTYISAMQTNLQALKTALN